MRRVTKPMGVLLLGSALFACQGELDTRGTLADRGNVHGTKDGRPTTPPGTPMEPTPGKPGQPGEPVGPEKSVCELEPQSPGIAPMRVLTEQELNNALRDLFHPIAVEPQTMTRDGRVGSFSINSVEAVEKAHVEDFRLMAESLSPIARENANALLDCNADNTQPLFAGASTGADTAPVSYPLSNAISTKTVQLIGLGNDTADGVKDSQGRPENGWNSIFEVRWFEGDQEVRPRQIHASESVRSTDPNLLIDQDPETRWAGHGDITLTFELEREATIDRVEIFWFRGDKRRAFFEVRALKGGTPTDAETCARHFVERFASKAFRRELAQPERDALLALYNTGADLGGAPEGVRHVVEAVLQAPSFMYAHEDVTQGARELGDFEIASRMATLLWRSLPDDELLEAASQGHLQDPRKRETHARRMLQDPRARGALNALVLQWFGIDHLETNALSPEGEETLDDEPALRAAMLSETRYFIDHVLWESTGGYPELFSAKYSFVNDRMARHYGIEDRVGPKDAKGFMRIDWDKRSGILGQASFLSQHHGPVHRGLFVRSALLCGQVPGPDNIDTNAIPTEAGESERSKAQKRLDHQTCGGCHNLMDNVGLTMDTFGALGRWREEDIHGNAVTSTGVLAGAGDVDGDLSNVSDLARRLARSREVEACVARNIFTYAFARGTTATDSCTLSIVEDALQTHDGDLKEALISLIQTDTFLKTTGGQP